LAGISFQQFTTIHGREVVSNESQPKSQAQIFGSLGSHWTGITKLLAQQPAGAQFAPVYVFWG
jgi:hypothetical protein